ncbi:hypothetical protein KCP71_21485 [Salmonella enterica subsp. enterica]|nr:hypothetical protein KCP71_21485 [Salmonella enterica subsp. enterica]
MVSIEPLCSSPSSSPAPLVSRSWVASANPAPKSSSDAIRLQRFAHRWSWRWMWRQQRA